MSISTACGEPVESTCGAKAGVCLLNDPDVKGVLFDLDGTLLDTRQAHLDSWAEAFSSIGKPIPMDQLAPLFGRSNEQWIQVLLSPEERERRGRLILELKEAAFAQRAPSIQVFPEVTELLRDLRAKGKLLALASSASHAHLVREAKRFDPDGLIAAVVGRDEVQRGKPDPETFLLAAARLGLRPEQSVAVGDSVADALAARAAGTHMIGVLSGGFTREQLTQAGAEEIYQEVAALRCCLEVNR